MGAFLVRRVDVVVRHLCRGRQPQPHCTRRGKAAPHLNETPVRAEAQPRKVPGHSFKSKEGEYGRATGRGNSRGGGAPVHARPVRVAGVARRVRAALPARSTCGVSD